MEMVWSCSKRRKSAGRGCGVLKVKGGLVTAFDRLLGEGARRYTDDGRCRGQQHCTKADTEGGLCQQCITRAAEESRWGASECENDNGVTGDGVVIKRKEKKKNALLTLAVKRLG